MAVAQDQLLGILVSQAETGRRRDNGFRARRRNFLGLSASQAPGASGQPQGIIRPKSNFVASQFGVLTFVVADNCFSHTDGDESNYERRTL
jgi:hypothetical protein